MQYSKTERLTDIRKLIAANISKEKHRSLRQPTVTLTNFCFGYLRKFLSMFNMFFLQSTHYVRLTIKTNTVATLLQVNNRLLILLHYNITVYSFMVLLTLMSAFVEKLCNSFPHSITQAYPYILAATETCHIAIVIRWTGCSCPCSIKPHQCPHTHTHTQPFYGCLGFVQDNPGELVPEDIHPLTPIVVSSHTLSASSINYNPWHPPCSIYMTYNQQICRKNLQFWEVHRVSIVEHHWSPMLSTCL